MRLLQGKKSEIATGMVQQKGKSSFCSIFVVDIPLHCLVGLALSRVAMFSKEDFHELSTHVYQTCCFIHTAASSGPHVISWPDVLAKRFSIMDSNILNGGRHALC